MTPSDTQLKSATPARVRSLIRSGKMKRPTSGLAIGYVQANLAFVPTSLADAFEEVCLANPSPLPLIERLPAGSTIPRRCAQDADLATDTGKYMKYDGKVWTVTPRLEPKETEAATAFVIGCSFTAENALLAAGVELRQIDGSGGVPVYRTTVELEPAHGLSGHLVVSMRAIKEEQVERAREITREFPIAHGEPVHVGPGALIGCRDGQEPDWGVPLTVQDGEVPVYWPCGVTPQTIIEESGMPWAYAHSPGHMFITDIAESTVRGRTLPEIRASLKVI